MNPIPFVILSLGLACVSGLTAEASFYNQPLLFSTAPDEKKSLNTIARFGPVGMAIDLHQPAFTMSVATIEAGSPAAVSGGLKTGQVIETINGRKLMDIDPRIQLGQIIEQAEATAGAVRFMLNVRTRSAISSSARCWNSAAAARRKTCAGVVASITRRWEIGIPPCSTPMATRSSTTAPPASPSRATSPGRSRSSIGDSEGLLGGENPGGHQAADDQPEADPIPAENG
jgi:hypothetical protein